MLIVAILAAVLYPKADISTIRAATVARKLLSDLRYAQQLANATQTRHGVIFNSTTQYTVFKNNDSGVPGTDPMKGGNYVVNMTGDFAGTTLSNTLTGGIVRFDSVGIPYEGTNGSQAVLAAARTITINSSTGSVKTITIVPTTGQVTMN